MDNVKDGKNNIYAALEEFATTELHVSDATLFSLKGALWTLAQRSLSRMVFRIEVV